MKEEGRMALKRIVVENISIAYARKENLAYVDKTRFIEKLENIGTRVPVFIRPRRFGKTFLAYTLYNYYDKSLAGQFDNYFKGTWIHSHKTPEASSYYCLRFDFSSVSADPSAVEMGMAEEVAGGLSKFSRRYPELGMSDEELNPKNYESPSSLLKAFLNNFVVRARHEERLFVIIDEYDHFANDILASDKDAFRKITSTSQSREGFIKQFYACLKQFYGNGSELPIARFFITGVSALSLDSLTSGFNIATNISSFEQFNDMAGFTHEELSKLIDETVDFKAHPGLSKDNLMNVMEKYYDGYVFSPDSDQRIFNPSMCLAFLEYVARMGKMPSVMPSNTGDDIEKLGGMLKLTDQESQQKIIDSIFRHEDVFAMEPGELNLNRGGFFDWNQTVWMLYYLGYLTISLGHGPRKYRCPNEVTYRAFIRYLAVREKIDFSNGGVDLTDSLKKGDISLLVHAVEKSVSSLPSTAFSGFNERTIQVCFYTILLFQANGMALTPSLEVDAGGRGRVDIFVESRCGGPDLMFELKYLSKAKADDAKVARALAEAKSQLVIYKEAPKFNHLKNLTSFAIVFVGSKAVEVEEI